MHRSGARSRRWSADTGRLRLTAAKLAQHTDGSFLAEPKVAISLYAPPSGALPAEGGETKFASCARGYDALTPELRSQVEGLASVHSWGKRQN